MDKKNLLVTLERFAFSKAKCTNLLLGKEAQTIKPFVFELAHIIIKAPFLRLTEKCSQMINLG